MQWEYEWDAARKDTRSQLMELREMESRGVMLAG